MLDLISKSVKELQVLSRGSVGRPIELVQAGREFPGFIVAIYFLVTTFRIFRVIPIKRFRSPFQEDSVKERSPRKDQENDVTTGAKFRCGLVVYLDGQNC